MKPNPDRDRKIAIAKQLRASGNSYTQIAEVVGVHWRTVMGWFTGYRAQTKYLANKRAKVSSEGLCVECWKAPKRSGKRLCQVCADKSQKRTREYIDAAREKVLSLLGGRCACTGEDCWHIGTCSVEDKRILTVDHNGSARLPRLKGGVRWLSYLKEIKMGLPVQLLCPNCHHMKDTKRSIA